MLVTNLIVLTVTSAFGLALLYIATRVVKRAWYRDRRPPVADVVAKVRERERTY